MKLLFYGESPCVATGLAQVSRTVLDAIQDDFEIEVVAINHHMKDYDHDRFPYLIHEDKGDHERICAEKLRTGGFDLFFYSADFGRCNEIIEALKYAHEHHTFYSVAYCPVDADLIPVIQFDMLHLFNVSIVYTEHARRVIHSKRPDLPVNVIYLATEPDVFYPLSQEKRRELRKTHFGIGDDTFLFINVNRNQPRKDLGRCFQIFKEFNDKHPDSALYMHSKQNDVGGCLPAMAQSVGIDIVNGPIYWLDPSVTVIHGVDRSMLNELYNCANCLITTATGGGWELSTTEAMSAGIPVIAPRNTAFVEIIGEKEERGYLAKSGGDIDHMQWQYAFSNTVRDIVHSDSMIEKMEDVYTDKSSVFYPTETIRKAKRAQEWCQRYTKEKIMQEWKRLFMALKREVTVG